MRSWLFSICLITLAGTLAADEPLGPAEYLKIVSESKLQYNISSRPSKAAMALPTCPRREESMRVVQRGAEKKLAPWPMKLEIVPLLSEGEKFFDAEKFDEAAAKYKAAIAKDPESATAYLFYGDTFLMGADDPASALAQYQKAIALDPTLPRPHFFASTAYLQLGRTADAREEIVRALTCAVVRIDLETRSPRSRTVGQQARNASSIRTATRLPRRPWIKRNRRLRRTES